MTCKQPLIALCLLAPAAVLQAADVKHGKELQQKHCMSCHDDSVYTRKDRFIDNPSSLRTQVQRCESTLGLQWFDEDVDAVTAYLNKKYYQFK